MVQAELPTAECTTRTCFSTPDGEDENPNSKKIKGLVLESSSAFTGVSVDRKRLFSLAEKGVIKTSEADA